MTFAEKFKTARKNAGLSQQQIADALGLDRSAIAHYENGDSMPALKNIIKVCKLLNLSVEELMEE